MAQRKSKGVGAAIGVAVGAAIAVVAFVLTLAIMNGGGSHAPPAPELGPDTASASPTHFQAPGKDPIVSAASADAATINFEAEFLSFAAVLPDAPPADPVVAELRKEAENYLASLKKTASADFERQKAVRAHPFAWNIRIRWDYTAKADQIVSLAGQSEEFTGGAHPIQRFDTRIARTDGQTLQVADMFPANRATSPAMTIAICEALKAAKMRKIDSPTIMGEPIVCAGPGANVKAEDAKLALAPSSQPDRFGGLYVYYEPYAVGAYAEGPYRLTVQQAVFADDLKPEFKSLFSGEAPELID